MAELNLRVPSREGIAECGTEADSEGSDSAVEGIAGLEPDNESDWMPGEGEGLLATSSILKLSYRDFKSALEREVPVERGGTKSSRAEAISSSGKGVGSSRPLMRQYIRNIAILNSVLSKR